MPKPVFLSQTLEELNIGTFQNIAVVHSDTPLYTALGIFVDQRVSALPVLDDKGENEYCVKVESYFQYRQRLHLHHVFFFFCFLLVVNFFLFYLFPLPPPPSPLHHTGRVVDIYSKFDVIVSFSNMCAQSTS